MRGMHGYKGKLMIFSIENLINEEVSKREDRKVKSWNASKLGSCLTGVYLERLGVKPDTEFDNRTLRVFRAGKLFEDFVAGLCGNTKDTNTELQVRAELPDYDATGYADMVITETDTQKKYVYEIKSKHSFSFKYLDKEGANRQHRMQTFFYMRALGIEEGRIFYISRDDLRVADFQVLLSDKELEKEVMEELKVLNEAWKQKLPPPIAFDDKDWRAKYCRWHSQCIKLTN